MNISIDQYERLFKLANKLRSAYWDKRKGSRQGAEKEHLTGLEIDKLLRCMNKQIREQELNKN